MSRSVSTPTNAAFAAYIVFEPSDPEDPFLCQEEFDHLIESITDEIKDKYPSFDDDTGWLDREDRIVLSNQFATVTVSEYMGLIAVAVVPFEAKYDYEVGTENLAHHWVASIEAGFKAALDPFGRYYHVATFSNGEAFYRRAA